MRQRKLYKSRLFILVLFILSITAIAASDNTGNNFQPVSSGQISSIFNMLSDKAHTNYAQIKSWQGNIDAAASIVYQGTEAERVFKERIDSEGKAPPKIKEQRESTVEFSANFETASFYADKYHREPLLYIDPNSGEVLKSLAVEGHTISVGTPDYKIISAVSAKKGDSLEYTAIKEERISKEDCMSCGDDIFDPRKIWDTGRPPWETFPLVIQFIEKHGEFSIDGYSLRVEERKDGAKTEYRIEIPGMVSPGEYLFQTMVFSSDNDFNVTSIETRKSDGKPFQKKSWEYKIMDGIYLPQKTTMENYRGENAELVYQSESMFSNQKINQLIPEETFNISNLKLKDGDIFIDKIENKTYRYNLSTQSFEAIKEKE